MLDSFKIDDFQIGDSQNPPHDTIYLATPRQISSSYTKEIYAIKVVTFQNPTSFQKNEANLKHYCQSIRLAYLLKPEGYAKSENQLFIFMEKMKCDLHSIIQNRVQKELYFTSEELKLFLKQMTLTLEELEKKSFPHSNLKPCNILQTMQGMYKMSDVGLQSMNEDSDYKAPELMNFPSKNLNLNYHKCDVFSLGMILLQMASLKSSKELQIFKSNSPDAFRNIENIFNDVKNRYGRIFQKILKDMLVLSDTNRKSITQMREDLEEYYNNNDIPATAERKDYDTSLGMEQKLVKQLFEAIAEKLMKREDDSSFFLKFDFNSFSKKIHRKDFLRAIDVLDIRINENDVLLISRVLDPDNDGYYDLTSLMQEISKNEKNPRSQQPFNSAYDRMEPLGEITEKALRSILDDLHTFCKKNDINYLEKCKAKDFYKKGLLLLDDFKFINKQLRFNLNESDYDLLQKKYDTNANNQIQYELLISDMESPYKNVTDDNVKSLYRRIREIYNTITDFFQKSDIDGNKVISREEFINLVKNLKLPFSATDLNVIWLQLDKSNNGKAYALNFRTLFLPYVEEDLKFMMTTMFRSLDNANMTLPELMKAYTKGPYISFPKLIDAFKYINQEFNIRDLSFILNECDIRNTQEINHESLENSLIQKAKDLNLNLNSKHTKSIKSNQNQSKKSLSTESKFYDRALNLKKSPGEVLFEKFRSKLGKFKQAEVMKLFKNVDKNNDRKLDFKEFVEIVNTFDNEIDPTDKRILYDFLDVDEDGKISSAEFFGRLYPSFYEDDNQGNKGFIPEKYEYALKFLHDVNSALSMKKKEAKEYFYSFDNKIAQVELRYNISQLGVNIDANPHVVMNKHELSKIFKIINDAMNFQGLTYESLFAKFDKFNENEISLADFNYAINEILKLSNIPNMIIFTNYLVEGTKISLQRLYKGLFDEAHTNKLLQDLKNLIYQNNLKIDKVFQKYDYNDNSLLEPGELFSLLKVLDATLTIEDSQKLFNKFDINNDGKISLGEFKRLISSESAGFDKENLTQSFFENLSILMQENGYSLQQLFGRNTADGKLPIDYFNSGLQFAGYEIERNQEKLKLVLSVLTQNMERNLINYQLFLTLFERYSKQSSNNSLTLSEDEKIRVKGFIRELKSILESRKLNFSKVFETKDKFQSGFISTEDMKIILLNELYLNQSPDLILFIRSLSPLNDGKISLNKLKSDFSEINNSSTSDLNYNKQMLPLDQFFFSIIPFFQNNPTSLLNYFFESKPFIPKTEFLNKCSSLNIFPKEQILYTYSKLDITFSGRVERSQIESILVMQPVQIQRQSFSGPGPTGLQISQIQTQNPTYQSSGGPNNKFGSQIPFGNQNQVSGFENSQNSNYGIQVGHQSFNSPTSLASQGIYNQSQQFGALQQGMSQVGNPQAMNQDSLLYQTQFINQNNTSGVNMNIPPQLIKEISNYVQGSKSILLREFKQIDRGMTGFLPVWDVKKVFQYNGYESIKVDELEEFAMSFGLWDNKNINYTKLFEVCDNLASIKSKNNTEYQSSHQIDILNRLREEILRMNLNLPLILQKYDKGNQLIFIREFTGELSNRNIHLNRDDISFLLAEVKPNSLNQINYIEMANFIMNNDRSSPSPFNPNTQFKNTQNISMNNQNYNINNQFNNPSMQHQNQGVFITVKEKIKAIYQSQGISLKALFRQIDLDNDNFISYKEFSDCLERKIDMHNLPPNLIDECFKQFDDDRDYKISYFEFSKHILNLDSIDHKKLLLKLKNQLLQKTSGEKDLLKLFKSMDKDNNGDLSFLEFTEALKNFNLSFTKNEIEDIFRYFDKGDKEKISYDHFVEVLSEDHLNLSPLREKIKNVIKEKGLSIKAYFRSLNSKGEDDFLNKKEFSDFLKKLGFKYDIEQEEELFETFDQDKDYLISYDEFNDLILENKQQDISSILKRLRQLVFSQKRDLLPEFEYLDSYREGLLSFQDFSKVLKKFSELSPFEIDCLFKGFIAVGSQKINYCEFWDCLLKIDCDIEPIKKKFDELCSRWNVDYEGLFNQFDQSGKGYLSPLDFDQMLLALHIRLPIEEVQEYFNAFDINKNGMLSQREFIEVLIGKKDKNKMMFLNVKSPVWKRSSDTYNTNQEFKFNEEFRGRKPLALNLKPSEWDEESSQHKFGNPPNRQTFGDSDGESSNFSPYKKEKNKGMNPVKSLFNKEEEEEHLEPKELVEIMKKQAYIKRLTLFSLFLEFDHNKTCVLTNIHDLETLIKYRLDLRQLSYSNIEVLFNYYSPDNGKTMNFIRLLMDIEDQSTVLIEMMKYVMKIQNVELADVFQNIDKDLDNVWDIKEFSSLNVLLNVGMERNEINKIFKQWDLNGNGLISILELEKIFNINSEGRINNKSQGINQKNNNFDSNQKNMNMNFNSKQKKMGEDFDQNQLYQKFKRLKDYIRYIYQIFQEKGILSNIYALFETNEPEMPRMKFLKDLMKLKINVERQEGNELASLLVSEKNFSFINLREFECLLKNFPYIFQEEESNKKTQSPNQKPLTNDINLIVQELKSIIEEEGFQLVSQYERNNSGFISEMDLNTALTKVLDPCEELNIFIKYVSQNGKVSLEELKKIFEVNERQKGQFTANSLGVKTNYKSSKIMNNNEKRIVKEDFKELQRAFGLYYPGKKLEDFIDFYFTAKDGSKLPLLDKERFFDGSVQLKSKLNDKKINDLFDLIDINASGTISQNEFMLLFEESDQLVDKQKANIRLPDELQKEIQELFFEVDVDRSNFIDKNELGQALMKVGMNPTNQELDEYFLKFDKDGNGKISYGEFLYIFQDKIKSEMMIMDELLSNLRREFKKADIYQNRLLNKEQLHQVFVNMDIDLQTNELEALFNEIDFDKSNSIDIDELIFFMTKNQNTVSPLAASALMNIRLSKKLSLADFKDVFKNMPTNFTLSFIRILNKKLKNLPSSYLKPKVDSSGLFYENLEFIHQARSEQESLLKKPEPKYIYEIKLLMAYGVPIPSRQNVKRESTILHRELKIGLFDQSNNKFIGNTVNVTAIWKQEYEDRWYLSRNYMGGENSIFLKIQDFEENKYKSVALIFEFVIYYLKENQLMEISCGYTSMDIININAKSFGKKKLTLEGGAPFKKIIIRKDDVKSNRTGWRNVVKKITKPIESQLEIEIMPLSKTSKDMNEIKCLPPVILVNKFATPILSVFREYLATKALSSGTIDLNLQEDTKVRAFLRCVDCPDVFEKLCKFWNETLIPKAPKKIIDCLSKTIDQLYLTLNKTEFKFNSSDPTAATIGTPLQKVRADSLQITFEEILVLLNMAKSQTGSKKISDNMNIEPMVLNDMGSDSDEENFLSQLKKKAKKHAIVENYDRPAKFQQFGSGLSGGGIPDRAHRIGNY